MKHMDYALRLGAICGLETVQEAVLNAERSAAQTLPYVVGPRYILALRHEHAKWIVAGGSERIPERIVREENERLRRYFANNPGSAYA